MAREVIRRQASDNEYLHKDFHGAFSAGIEYLNKNFGPEAVREYLHQFATSFYAPLIDDINRRGLAALKDRLESVYRTEQATVNISLTEDELVLEVESCPAVMHMREHGYQVAAMFPETSKAVYEALCENTPFSVEVCSYDRSTGASLVRFRRRHG